MNSECYNRFHIPTFSINGIIYSNFIRYEELRKLVLNEFQGTPEENCTEINLFIDLYSLMKNAYYGDNFIINQGEEFALTAGVINMAAHYRFYFQSRHSVKTNIFIVSSFNTNKYITDINPKYRSYIRSGDPRIEYFIENIKLLSSIVPYVPNMFFKHYNYATSASAIRDIMGYNVTHGNTNPNIIITKDILNWQLVNFKPARTVVFRPKKMTEDKNSVDLSYTIDSTNLMRVLAWERCRKNKTISNLIGKYYEKIDKINPELFSAFLSLIGCVEYGYNAVLSFPSALNAMYKVIVEKGLYLNQYTYNPLELFRLIYDNLNTQRSMNIVELESRFRTLDTIYLYDQMQAIDLELLKKIPNDLYNPDLLKRLNEKYFTENPLDLNVL